MVLIVAFRVENDVFIKWLRVVIQEDKTTQNILKEMSLGDVEGFTKEDRFLLF